MSPKKTIQLKVDKQGNVQVMDVTGAGGNCQELTSGLEKALGIVDEKSREVMPSCYQDVDPLKLTVEGQ